MATSSYPIRVAITGATSGNNTLVAAATGYKIRVISYTIVAAGEVAFRLESGAGGTALTGVMTLIKGTPVTVSPHLEGIVETASGALLNMELGGAVQVSGHMTYSLIAA